MTDERAPVGSAPLAVRDQRLGDRPLASGARNWPQAPGALPFTASRQSAYASSSHSRSNTTPFHWRAVLLKLREVAQQRERHHLRAVALQG